MNISFVTHCWAGDLPQYAHCLAMQLHALRGTDATVYVCRAPDYNDRLTYSVVCKAVEQGVRVVDLPMMVARLGRRSIGRHLATTLCDWRTFGLLVFTDADYVWTKPALDALVGYAAKWPEGASMIFPKTVQINRTHDTGDATWQSAGGGALDIVPGDYEPKRYSKAIGGCQIVLTATAARIGYANSPKWQQPVSVPFGDFRDDLAARRAYRDYGQIVGVDIPGVYRVRHTRTTYQ